MPSSCCYGLYKSLIRPRMEYWCYVYTGTAQSLLSGFKSDYAAMRVMNYFLIKPYPKKET